MVYCSNCDEYFSIHALYSDIYCPKCGKALKCPECSSPIDANAKTCSSCGALFSNEDEDYYSNPVVPTDGMPGAEFIEGKSKAKLEMELQFVTRALEDCQKTGDYMVSYYGEKKKILERALGYRN